RRSRLQGFFILQRSVRSLLVLLLVIISSIFIYQNLEKIAPVVANRIVGKYQTRIQKNVSGEGQLLSEDSFIAENIRDALTAFNDNPVFGTGIGGFTENYSQHEVHSTYFKIIGETGILGILAYVIFMYNVFSLLKYHSRRSPLREFLFYILPFFIGCLVSWSYTYHMRKREFWILMSVLVIVNTLIERNIWLTKWRINKLILENKLKAHESQVV
ncbi:O-antigen ligase like membrane protein, partial [Bacteroidales bacterium 6E]